ncbi:hypothetical protein P3342_000553 [Pyrenophora teres f. teres]|uniref:Uncharacterized protein n=1 Tax=Pyrenophora teres f. teres (strain 0-1) TaxID=861557 RepID=E3RVR5_PYRTT|nr:hypothetical protein PTT_13296 [Pyrenophora teres f. teres 0-1]KAE8862566.1 hypothetical protein PTNB29_05128 [Pyrenophora teres f. teres]KAK1917836.1 hypothetical protein P3342_000553 [Pyrenophora teres f. teres]
MTSSLATPPSNLQLQSPLFGVLPGEIRNTIFELALMSDEDDEGAYPEDSYWYRPGFSGPLKGSSALLRTCRMAYREGQKVFLRELEAAFWFDRGPEGRSGNSACENFFKDLTPQASQSLQKVRFFTQMYWLEDGYNIYYLLSLPQFRPTQLTITIRYSDWWHWEHDYPLRMEDHWLRFFMGSPGLRVLQVEYETLSWKKEDMMRIIQRNKKWKLPVRSEAESFQTVDMEGHLSAEGTKLKEWKWKGTSKLGGGKWAHHGTADKVEYIVVTDTWKFVDTPLSTEEMRGRDDGRMEEAPATRGIATESLRGTSRWDGRLDLMWTTPAAGF